MTKRKIDVTDYAKEITKSLAKGILITAKYGDKINPMVIGWGHVGRIWEKDVFVAYVRESRYTRELLDKSGEFTINVPIGTFDKKIMTLCGTKSGRDMDKIKETGLTPEEPEVISVPGLKEFPLTLECRVLYSQKQESAMLEEPVRKLFYTPGTDRETDDHIAYYGEIVAAYIIE